MGNLISYSVYIIFVILIIILIYLIIQSNKNYKIVKKMLDKAKSITTWEEIQEVRKELDDFKKSPKITDHYNIIYITEIILDTKEMMINKHKR